MERKNFIIQEIKHDRISLSQKGFIIKNHGRLVYIYYISNDYIVLIEGEVSGVVEYELIIYADYNDLDYGFYPELNTFKALTRNEKKELREALANWLSEKHIRHDIVL